MVLLLKQYYIYNETLDKYLKNNNGTLEIETIETPGNHCT